MKGNDSVVLMICWLLTLVLCVILAIAYTEARKKYEDLLNQRNALLTATVRLHAPQPLTSEAFNLVCYITQPEERDGERD
jgi:hypothetical protein